MHDVLDGDDQGARNPGRDRAGEQLQPRRARPRGAGQGRHHRGGGADCSGLPTPRSSTRCRWPGSTARRCAPTAMRPTPARARAGRPATPPARGVRLALMVAKGEMGYPSVLTAKTWGFYDVLFKGKPFSLPRPYGSYVMENVLFKISFPAEFHAQTAVECAMALHPQLVRLASTRSSRITIRTHESALRIIDKKGPLANPADRDHCIQYMVAVPLIFGRLTAADYEDERRRRPAHRRAARRAWCASRSRSSPRTTSTRTSARSPTPSGSNSTTAAALDEVVVEYPIGHRRRRSEGIPLLLAKFKTNLARRFPAKQQQAILELALDPERLRGDAGARVRRPVCHLSSCPLAKRLDSCATIRRLILSYSFSPPASSRRRKSPKRKSGAVGHYPHLDATPEDQAAAICSCASTQAERQRPAASWPRAWAARSATSNKLTRMRATSWSSTPRARCATAPSADACGDQRDLRFGVHASRAARPTRRHSPAQPPGHARCSKAKWSGPCQARASARARPILDTAGQKVNIYDEAKPAKGGHGAAAAKKELGGVPPMGRPGRAPAADQATPLPTAPSASKAPPASNP